nr:hypothetical protein L204_03735 [Cryptococcus depauperatus CBS 7855]
MSSIIQKLRKTPYIQDKDTRSHRSASNSSSVLLSEEERHVQLPPPTQWASKASGKDEGLRFATQIVEEPATTPTGSQQPMAEGQTRTPGRLAPLELPASGTRQAVDTPRLTLTKEGSNSPRSVSDHSPIHSHISSREESEGIGLGRPSQESLREESSETATAAKISHATARSMSTSIPLSSRDRANSLASSSYASNGHRSRSGSIVSKVTSRISGNTSPNRLRPTESKSSSKKSKNERRKSINSTTSVNSGVVAALVKGGLHIASPTGEELVVKATRTSRKSRNRGSYHQNREGDENDGACTDGHYAEGYEEEEGDSDLPEDMSVMGYAVASNRRNSDFHSLFQIVEPEDYLIDDYGCALSKDILVQGRLYISENYLCFHANIFGWTTDVVIPFADVRGVEKKMTALVIPNAIGITTASGRASRDHSFLGSDAVIIYDVIVNIWRLCIPSVGVTPSRSSSLASTDASNDPAAIDPSIDSSVRLGKNAKPTRCACGRDGGHYTEVALEATLPGTPEKVYNLMFNSVWLKAFLTDSQNLKNTDIEYSDWRPSSPNSSILCRSLSYIKPLNGSIGPKQTLCHITDTREHFDPNDYICMVTSTKTPDVPSGGVFSVKTRTCFMWAGSNSTKVIVTTKVEWTGKSWIKGIIDKSAIDGQKAYHNDLKVSMLSYIQSHLSEFLPPGTRPEIESSSIARPTLSRHGTSVQTPAQEYAEQALKDRQEKGLWNLQVGVDSLVNGGKAVWQGLRACSASISEILMEKGFSIKDVMGFLIVILLISNFYTYLSLPGRSIEERLVARQNRKAYDQQVAEAVRLVLGQRALADPREEATELLRVLDHVEVRMIRLREELSSVVQYKSQNRDNTQSNKNDDLLD